MSTGKTTKSRGGPVGSLTKGNSIQGRSAGSAAHRPVRQEIRGLCLPGQRYSVRMMSSPYSSAIASGNENRVLCSTFR